MHGVDIASPSKKTYRSMAAPGLRRSYPALLLLLLVLLFFSPQRKLIHAVLAPGRLLIMSHRATSLLDKLFGVANTNL